jgi:hypothetical protein
MGTAAIIALLIVLLIMVIIYHAVSSCVEGEGGVLCKLLHFLV